MSSRRRFTTDQAADLLERAAKAELADAEQDLSLADVLELARNVGIEPAFVERELVRERHAVPTEKATDGRLQTISPQLSPLRIHEGSEYFAMTADPAGWSRHIVSRMVLWGSVLGFVGYFAVNLGLSPVTAFATAPFVLWGGWSALRLVCLTRERASVVLSPAAFSVRVNGCLYKRELAGRSEDLLIEPPRIARDPEGGIEVFPLYFLRLRTETEDIDILRGHSEGDVKRAHRILKAWHSRAREHESVGSAPQAES